jgi:copper chaperone
MRTVTFAITGMHCASCGLLIDDCLLDVDGVADARTNLKTEQTVVQADDTVADAELLAAIAEAGYVGTLVGAG